MCTVWEIIAEHFNVAPAVIDDAMKISELHPDDLDLAEVVMEIEDEYGIDLLGDAVTEVWRTGTVGDLVRVVEERCSSDVKSAAGA
jgi:acyl carrier protein